ncbi:MAG: GNAT family N-acetyltransferase [Acidimicrobiia bacterium]
MTLRLDDGAEVILSPLLFEDRKLIEAGFAQLSERSRYTRFGQGRAALSDSELDYLANVDQTDHVAWGVSVDGSGVGVGRYIVSRADRCAEVAVTVVDEYQGRGIGRLLLETLVATARHDGVEEFCFDVVPDNAIVRHMLIGIAEDETMVDGLMVSRVTVADLPEFAIEDDAKRVLTEFRSN